MGVILVASFIFGMMAILIGCTQDYDTATILFLVGLLLEIIPFVVLFVQGVGV